MQKFLGELAEKAFYDVESGAVGRREMHMEPWAEGMRMPEA